MSDLPEHELVRRAMAGDRRAVERLWLASRSWLTASLLAHIPAGSDLEDLLQEVAIQLMRGVRGLKSVAAFAPWLRAVAVNAARSAGRKASVRQRVQRPMENLDLEIADPRHHVAREHERTHQRLERVLQLVSHLPTELREPLLLKAVEGMSQRQIAAALEVPETTVETRLARARRLLRAGDQADVDQMESGHADPMAAAGCAVPALRGARNSKGVLG